MKQRLVAVLGTALGLTLCAAAPANARYIGTDPTTSGQTNALLKVDDHSTVSKDGWSVRWKIKLTCPRGSSYTGYAIVDQRNPASIPELSGDDAGIRARTDLAGTCTGRQQILRLTLPVQDTSFFDPALGMTRTVHEPIAPSTATNHAVQIYDADAYPGAFFTQYCAAPACADNTGRNLPIR